MMNKYKTLAEMRAILISFIGYPSTSTADKFVRFFRMVTHRNKGF